MPMGTSRGFWGKRHDPRTYRSGLEDRVANHLKAALNAEPQYEQYYIPYTVPVRTARYTPDFVLPNGIIIETKGRFLPEDRQKHLLIKEQWPELDIRFVFSSSRTKLYKGSSTSYADWCEKHGFAFADRNVPPEWIVESVPFETYQAVMKVLKPTKGEDKR